MLLTSWNPWSLVSDRHRYCFLQQVVVSLDEHDRFFGSELDSVCDQVGEHLLHLLSVGSDGPDDLIVHANRHFVQLALFLEQVRYFFDQRMQEENFVFEADLPVDLVS